MLCTSCQYDFLSNKIKPATIRAEINHSLVYLLDFGPKELRGKFNLLICEKIEELMSWYTAHNFARYG